MTVRVLQGDCRDVLRTLPDASVQCVVTSPPYYGLRDYGTAQWDGGNPACDHTDRREETYAPATIRNATFRNNDGTYLHQRRPSIICKCGARRIDAQLGLEPTPDEYVAQMVAVFREVRRVLRPDGTCWVNLGDSYSGAHETGRRDASQGQAILGRQVGRKARDIQQVSIVAHGVAAKNLLMMPARVALALQADGWWLRSDIIWHKLNPMPESCTDRPTSAHEHVFLLAKNAQYFFDAYAVREPDAGQDHTRNVVAPVNRSGGYLTDDRGIRTAEGRNGAGRNIRNVWTIATAPYAEAHFATFPPELAARCIRAGTSERGCCANCGAPWVRQVDKKALSPLLKADEAPIPDCWKGDKSRPRVRAPDGTFLPRTDDDRRPDSVVTKGARAAVKRMGDGYDITTTGWLPSCRCDADSRPCVVLDPFGGAGTVGMVADRLQRDAVLIELNPAYVEMAKARTTADAPLFAEVV